MVQFITTKLFNAPGFYFFFFHEIIKIWEVHK